MTPRSVIVSEPADMYANEFYELQEELIFSRILLEESKESENIIGYVLKDEVLEHLLDDENHKQLKDFKRNIITVPETHTMLNMFNDFIKSHEHIALVIDEYNGVAGLSLWKMLLKQSWAMRLLMKLIKLQTCRNMPYSKAKQCLIM